MVTSASVVLERARALPRATRTGRGGRPAGLVELRGFEPLTFSKDEGNRMFDELRPLSIQTRLTCSPATDLTCSSPQRYPIASDDLGDPRESLMLTFRYVTGLQGSCNHLVLGGRNHGLAQNDAIRRCPTPAGDEALRGPPPASSRPLWPTEPAEGSKRLLVEQDDESTGPTLRAAYPSEL